MSEAGRFASLTEAERQILALLAAGHAAHRARAAAKYGVLLPEPFPPPYPELEAPSLPRLQRGYVAGGGWAWYGQVARTLPNAIDDVTPFDVYATADGHCAIAAPSEHLWALLCEAMGRPDLVAAPETATNTVRVAGRPLVDTFVTEVSQDTWIMFPWDTEPQFVRPLAGDAADEE